MTGMKGLFLCKGRESDFVRFSFEKHNTFFLSKMQPCTHCTCINSTSVPRAALASVPRCWALGGPGTRPCAQAAQLALEETGTRSGHLPSCSSPIPATHITCQDPGTDKGRKFILACTSGGWEVVAKGPHLWGLPAESTPGRERAAGA